MGYDALMASSGDSLQRVQSEMMGYNNYSCTSTAVIREALTRPRMQTLHESKLILTR